jgi:hypothetical protein
MILRPEKPERIIPQSVQHSLKRNWGKIEPCNIRSQVGTPSSRPDWILARLSPAASLSSPPDWSGQDFNLPA